VEGSHPELKEELVIVEGFYDSTSYVLGVSPGADEASSIATLLAYARDLKENPPERSVLLVATSGHAQTLTGMREMIWSIRARSKLQRDMQRDLKNTIDQFRKMIEVLHNASIQGPSLIVPGMEGTEDLIKEALSDRIKTEVDQISRDLMLLRLEKKDVSDEKIIQKPCRSPVHASTAWMACRFQ
jgi:hypothetical protein